MKIYSVREIYYILLVVFCIIIIMDRSRDRDSDKDLVLPLHVTEDQRQRVENALLRWLEEENGDTTGEMFVKYVVGSGKEDNIDNTPTEPLDFALAEAARSAELQYEEIALRVALLRAELCNNSK